MSNTIIKDDKGRPLISINEGNIAVARYEDLSDEMKEYVAKVYIELTGKSSDDLMSFLNFEADNEFCS
jgi:hypothetical protein